MDDSDEHNAGQASRLMQLGMMFSQITRGVNSSATETECDGRRLTEI